MKVRNEGNQMEVSGALNSEQKLNFVSGQKILLPLKVRNEGNQMEVSGTLNSKQIWNFRVVKKLCYLKRGLMNNC